MPPSILPDAPNFLEFFIALQTLFWVAALMLPRPWFKCLFKIAFPFLPDNPAQRVRR